MGRGSLAQVEHELAYWYLKLFVKQIDAIRIRKVVHSINLL